MAIESLPPTPADFSRWHQAATAIMVAHLQHLNSQPDAKVIAERYQTVFKAVRDAENT